MLFHSNMRRIYKYNIAPPTQNPASAHRQSRHMPEAGFPVLRVSYPTTHTLAARDLPLLCGSSSISNVTF